jgi:Tripartite tricarboxylate transporter family receptor
VGPSALAVNSRFGVSSVAELIALLKKNPGKYNFGSIGNGSLSHLAMAALALKSGTEIVHIPYASSPQAMTALVRGDVDIVCLPAISVTPHVASGDVKILAVSTAARSPLLPDVPTLKEAGIDVEADAWMGLIAPAKTPAVVARIAREVGAVIAAPDCRAIAVSVSAPGSSLLIEPAGARPGSWDGHPHGAGARPARPCTQPRSLAHALCRSGAAIGRPDARGAPASPPTRATQSPTGTMTAPTSDPITSARTATASLGNPLQRSTQRVTIR